MMVMQVHGYKELMHAVRSILDLHPAAIVEEFIKGREITCGVVDMPDGQDPQPLLPVEIIVPSDESVWGYESKYSGRTTEICPAEIDDELMSRIQVLAVAAHNVIGLRHYSRTDFIVNREGVWLLEINSLPGLTEESLLPKSLKAAGLEFPDFLDYIVTLAMERK